jgi:hypothetical protein
MMVTYVLFPKKDAIPRLEAMKENADYQAEQCGLKEQDWWWDFLDDDTLILRLCEEREGPGRSCIVRI